MIIGLSNWSTPFFGLPGMRCEVCKTVLDGSFRGLSAEALGWRMRRLCDSEPDFLLLALPGLNAKLWWSLNAKLLRS